MIRCPILVLRCNFDGMIMQKMFSVLGEEAAFQVVSCSSLIIVMLFPKLRISRAVLQRVNAWGDGDQIQVGFSLFCFAIELNCWRLLLLLLAPCFSWSCASWEMGAQGPKSASRYTDLILLKLSFSQHPWSQNQSWNTLHVATLTLPVWHLVPVMGMYYNESQSLYPRDANGPAPVLCPPQ